ncbi:SpoIIE family protein phosphatase [Limnofasciculus baicalensis]|uniref:SpoIIE family protein phosphatase n=1 Tax=Limnofasciculus baicalensis BBK-W-15 TaxID=2699891 RepID=A0AAE3GMH4_9CYAN|nr:SpoIIE family protein phosphatase [Limnofasciculus baicalensis]MCP2727325.1 SpoIIE family protein phosphatase [Limnofasciculus baicalensis BBK-W-15]
MISTPRLPRTLSSLETWGFGLTGLLLWMGVAPGANAELGQQGIFVWLVGTIIGILLNLQVKRLGSYWPDMSGGTPNYITRLLQNYPGIARYGAIGYYISWVAVLPVNAIILTDLIEANLKPLGINCPEILLTIGFTLLAFVVAFSGTRAISILHLVFVLPAVGFLLVFSIQGMTWLAFSKSSPGLIPPTWSSFEFDGWAKWFLNATYAVYACETASSFVADSKKPGETLRSLSIAAWLIPVVYLGGSWVLMRLATQPGLKDDTFLNLLAAASPFWGNSAPYLVTFLVASSSLLACATAVSNCPRILYQLAADGHLSPVFAVTSRQGVFAPGLFLTLLLSLLCLVWGNVPRIVMVTGVGWISAFISLHWGLWLWRGRREVLFPWLSLGFCLMELVVLVIGGLAWSGEDLLIGLLLPIVILAIDRAIRYIRFAPFHPAWWKRRYSLRSRIDLSSFLGVQVGILILLICSAMVIGWFFGSKSSIDLTTGANLLEVLILVVAFVGVAIACWTSLPQVLAIAEAREQSEHLFNIAIDAILVLDENGTIRKANPVAEQLLSTINPNPIGTPLNQIFLELNNHPDTWLRRSEYTLNTGESPITLEAAISDHFNQDFREYVVIMRDITNRKQAEETMQNYNRILAQKVSERTAELAQANAEIIDLNNRLKAENIRMKTELDVTRQIQQMILPKASELNGIPGLEIAGFMEPAAEVGGDYYDVLQYEGRVKIGIGDVTGHGLESGVLTIMVQTAVRTLLENNETDPRQFLDVINRTIYNNVQRMGSDKNLSLCLLEYHECRLYLSGQHEEMILVRAGGNIERIDTIDLGFPIGLEADITDFISEVIIHLHPGDVVVLYTDGITEAEDVNGLQYGLERLCQIVSCNWQESADDIRQAVIQDLRSHIGSHTVYDDITLLILKQK